MKRIKVLSIIVLMMWFSFFQMFFIPDIIYKIIKLGFIIITLFYIIKNCKEKSFYINFVNLMLLLMIISNIHSLSSHYISRETFFNGIIYIVMIFICNSLVKLGKNEETKKNIINVTYKVFLFIYLGSVIRILFIGTSKSADLLYYFVGNKFTTSYVLIFFNILYAYVNNINITKKKKISYIFLTLMTIFLCHYLNCSTATVASLLLLLVLLKNEKIKQILMNKRTIIISVLLSGLFVIFWETLLSNEYVIRFITNILHENVNLTGRINIYRLLVDISSRSFVFGYGYGNEIIKNTLRIGYTNAQNGLFQIILQYGILATISFIIMIARETEKTKKNMIELWPMFIFLYIMIVCSLVEVTYNALFFFTLFYIGSSQKYNVKF